MTELDSSGRIPGYCDSPFPGEDGGPRRQMIGRGSALGIADGERVAVTVRPITFGCMVVLRAPGEVFVQGNAAPSGDTTSWVERIDPETLETIARSPDMAGGPFWPGGILGHENGFLYVTFGRWCHKLDVECRLIASRELPRARQYNSLLALSDGNLVMKDFIRDGSDRSQFSVLEPDGLEPAMVEVEIPEGSIARISRDITADGEYVYVVGDHTIFRYAYGGGALVRDEAWSFRYRTEGDPAQSYGWDPVIADGSAWFMDNGDNVYRGGFRGNAVATGPLHLYRVSLTDARDVDVLTPFGMDGGTIVNPPLVDASRKIAVAFDSGNARIGAFRYGGSGFERMWEREMGASLHFLLYPESGEIVVNDFDGTSEHVVVLDIESGEERARVRTAGPLQAATFQAPGWSRDVYTATFTTLSGVYVEA